MTSRIGLLATLTLAFLTLFAAACGGDDASEADASSTGAPADAAATQQQAPAGTEQRNEEAVQEQAQETNDAVVVETRAPAGPYLLFNQRLIEGQTAEGIDLKDADSLFRAIFEGLPDEVTVYPSENYYYFILYVDTRQVWGNIRLPAGRRENGVLSFGYFEFDEFPPSTGRRGISGSKFFTDADGVIVSEVDRFTYTVRFRGKTVTFHFHQLDQSPPDSLVLAEDETFTQRTLDESGYHFALIFNEQSNFFLWVLNEDEPPPETLDPLGENLLIGRRSGFAFWIDAANQDRLVLAGVRQLNIRRNDYYDGPFDQLADNYAEEVRIAEYMVRAFPSLEGRIDKYGYYTDTERPLRVAISAYYTYSSQAQMLQFIELAQARPDSHFYISRGGRVSVTEGQEEDADGS